SPVASGPAPAKSILLSRQDWLARTNCSSPRRQELTLSGSHRSPTTCRGPHRSVRLIPAVRVNVEQLLDDRLRDSFPIGPGVGRRIVRLRPGVVQNGLAPAHLLRIFSPNPNFVTEFREPLQRRWRNTHFDRHVAPARSFLSETRRFECFLNVHSVIDNVRR